MNLCFCIIFVCWCTKKSYLCLQILTLTYETIAFDTDIVRSYAEGCGT